MDSQEKLLLLLSAIFLVVIFVSFLITIRSIGNITHSLDRLKEIVSKETVLSYNRAVSEQKAGIQREQATQERVRRQEALLNVPLMKKDKEAK